MKVIASVLHRAGSQLATADDRCTDVSSFSKKHWSAAVRSPENSAERSGGTCHLLYLTTPDARSDSRTAARTCGMTATRPVEPGDSSTSIQSAHARSWQMSPSVGME